MLSRYNPIDIEAALRSAAAKPPFPPASDRAAWAAVRQAIGEERAAEIIAQAEIDRANPTSGPARHRLPGISADWAARRLPDAAA